MRILTFILSILVSTNIFSNNIHISSAGKRNIMKNENCSLTAYWDSNGWSIGYGHHGKDVKKGMKISKAKAIHLFNQDIKRFDKSVERLINDLPIKHKFSQNFIDGLYDLVYNCGEEGVRQSTFYKRLKACRKNNKNDMNFAIAAVRDCRISAPGHKERRYNTQILMLTA